MRFHHVHGLLAAKPPIPGLIAFRDVVATIAYNGNDHGGWFGVAYCAPGDQFWKKKGRMIAEGRCLKRIHWIDRANDEEWLSAFARVLADNFAAPGWASNTTWDLSRFIPRPADTIKDNAEVAL